mmetsp:Transcript_23996/g.76036  ORF Transcript_23996/g.76036 Transcript_23996/m.76036 type:complete len:207 (-) Transcript_23996:628-1248(-)
MSSSTACGSLTSQRACRTGTPSPAALPWTERQRSSPPAPTGLALRERRRSSKPPAPRCAARSRRYSPTARPRAPPPPVIATVPLSGSPRPRPAASYGRLGTRRSTYLPPRSTRTLFCPKVCCRRSSEAKRGSSRQGSAPPSSASGRDHSVSMHWIGSSSSSRAELLMPQRGAPVSICTPCLLCSPGSSAKTPRVSTASRVPGRWAS